MVRRGKAGRKRIDRGYTQGELNRLVDSLLHPLAKGNSNVMLLDGVIHAMIEQNPSESTLKFVKDERLASVIVPLGDGVAVSSQMKLGLFPINP